MQLRLCPPRGLSQGARENAAGREVQPPDHRVHRHTGAYPGISAEERGQAAIIAENLMAMSQIRTPIVCVVIGEGGSGGALGIGIGDRLAMLEFTYYSVISPEGCASILWKGSEHAPKAAAALKMTSRDLLGFGIIDEIIAEPPGGAHRDHREAAANLKTFLIHAIRLLREIPTDQLVSQRYDKYRKIGVFHETVVKPELNGPATVEGSLPDVTGEPDLAKSPVE